MPVTLSDWNAALECALYTDGYTWSPTPLGAEELPVNCVTWYEAYAFCIWDGGFLPSEAEWAYAATGGHEQRRYPWGATDPNNDATYAVYNCDYGTPHHCSGRQNFAPVGSTPSGIGVFAQWDLAGNVAEWTLDAYGPYVTPCADCAAFSGPANRSERGGGALDRVTTILAADREYADPAGRYAGIGIRCARSP
jgi:formylglycine-generating enzyme required for sulfatase activity